MLLTVREFCFTAKGSMPLLVERLQAETGRGHEQEAIACLHIASDRIETCPFVDRVYLLTVNDLPDALGRPFKAAFNATGWAALYNKAPRPFARLNSVRTWIEDIDHLENAAMTLVGGT